ncbi:MAG TPA: ABC transporter ATP-binding protein [Pseudonocardiaceae bacterium]|nr:ABC transporter ATP-binding protein [Pseudonocardiaceae bacterium]
MTTTVLEVEHLGVTFATEDGPVLAVKDMSFAVRPGEILALVGESGCGKTVTAMSIPGLLPSDGVARSGTVRLAGRDLTTLAERELESLRGKDISVVFQEPMTSLNPAYTVGKQIVEVLRRHQSLNRGQALDRAVELLTLVGIPDARRRCTSFPHQLSGGMRQRVMIAMALALEPRVVIMDEPTTALDVVTQREILEELIGLRDRLGFAVLFITHDLSLLIELADSIAVMYAGRLVERASAAALFRSPRHPYTRGLLNSFPSLHGEWRRMTGIAGSPPDLRHVPSGCAFHPRCPHAFDRCSAETPKLVEIGGGDQSRVVSCWLHDSAAPGTPAVPEDLALPEPMIGSAS